MAFETLVANVVAPASTVEGLELLIAVLISIASVEEPSSLTTLLSSNTLEGAAVTIAIDVALVGAEELVAAGMAEVTIAVPAFNQGETTHLDASELSTNLPFCFDGVKLRRYEVEKLPAAQAIYPKKTSEF